MANINRNDSTSFNTTNMKPVAGEVIDSLWASNLADNTGYNFYQKGATLNWGPVFGIYEDNYRLTTLRTMRGRLELTPNTILVGTYRPFAEGINNIAGSFTGTLYVGGTAVSTFSRGTGYSQNSEESTYEGENDVDFEYDISSLGTVGYAEVYFEFQDYFDTSGWFYEPDSYGPGYFSYGLSFTTLKTEA